MTDFKETIAYLNKLFYPIKTKFSRREIRFPQITEIDGIKIKCASLTLKHNPVADDWGGWKFILGIKFRQDNNLNNFSHKSQNGFEMDIDLCDYREYVEVEGGGDEEEFNIFLTELLTDSLKKIEDIKYNPLTDYFEIEDTNLLIPCFQELHTHLKKNVTNLTLNDIECSVCYKLTTLRIRRCDHTLCRNCAWKLREKCEPAGQGKPKCPICRRYMDSDDDSDDNNDY